MRRPSFFLFFVLHAACAGLIAFGQLPAPAITYSESIPYKPRLFSIVSAKKSKDKKETVVVEDQQPEKMPGSGPAVKEGPSITITVSAFDSQGNFVSGLTKGDFKVYVDGSEATIQGVERRKQPVNVLLVIDTSPSGVDVFEAVKKGALATVGQFAPEDKIMVFRFTSSLKTLTPLTADRETITDAIGKMKLKGSGTSLYDATKELFEDNVPQLAGRTVVLLITDGVDTTSRTRYWASLVAAEKTDASVFPIYLDTFSTVSKIRSITGARFPGALPGSIENLLNRTPPPTLGMRGTLGTREVEYEIGRHYLNDLVFLSGGRTIDANELFEGKPKIRMSIADELREQYYVTFSPVGPSVLGQRKHLKVRVERPNLAVAARGSYIVGSPPSKIDSQ